MQGLEVSNQTTAFNRTSMESKPRHGERTHDEFTFLLIEPVWNRNIPSVLLALDIFIFYSKARKYVNTEDLGLPTSLARFPNLANANVYR